MSFALLSVVLAACEPFPEVYQAVVLSEVAAIQAKAGDSAGAKETAMLALEIAKSADERTYRFFAADFGYYRDRAWALAPAAAAQTRAGDEVGALDVATRVEDVSDRVRTLGVIAVAQADAGDQAGGRQTAALALDIAKSVADERLLAFVAWARAKAADLDDALALVKNIEDDDLRSLALNMVALARAQAGDVEGVVDSGRSITDDANVALLWQALTGDVTGAADTFVRLPAMEAPGAWTLGAIAVAARMEAGDVEGARRAAARVLDVAKSATENSERAWALSATAAAHAEAGDLATARQTAAHALDSAMAVTESEDRARALGAAAWALATAGDVAAALDTVNKIEGPVTPG